MLKAIKCISKNLITWMAETQGTSEKCPLKALRIGAIKGRLRKREKYSKQTSTGMENKIERCPRLQEVNIMMHTR